jgi:AhpD family alkylhydroperoxidase
VGGLPDVPGIRAAIQLTPALGSHLLGLADALLVDEYPGATIERAEREMLAEAVSAANDCFFCMDSHGAHAAALLEKRARYRAAPAGGRDQGRLVRQVLAEDAGLDPDRPDRWASGLATSRRTTSRWQLASGASDGDVQLAVLIAVRVLHVQPDGGRIAGPNTGGPRDLPAARRSDRRARLQRSTARGRCSPLNRAPSSLAASGLVPVIRFQGRMFTRQVGPPSAIANSSSSGS